VTWAREQDPLLLVSWATRSEKTVDRNGRRFPEQIKLSRRIVSRYFQEAAIRSDLDMLQIDQIYAL